MATGASNQQTARAGEHFVAGELNRRGAYAVTFAGNMPRMDILATDRSQARTVRIQVKTRRVGSWQTSIDEGKKCRVRIDEESFWVFVDLGKVDEPPGYFIVPESWIRNDIYRAHQAYLKRHGGRRKAGSDSKHHSITPKRIEAWRHRWEILGVF